MTRQETTTNYTKAMNALNRLDGSTFILECIHSEIKGIPNDPEENPVCLYLKKEIGIEFTIVPNGIDAINFLQMPETIPPPFWVGEFLNAFDRGKLPALIKGAENASGNTARG
jgi:hypothetical protein